MVKKESLVEEAMQVVVEQELEVEELPAILQVDRAARIARLPRSLLDPESFPHTAYVKILATLARKTVN